jgi:hypothetical protein
MTNRIWIWASSGAAPNAAEPAAEPLVLCSAARVNAPSWRASRGPDRGTEKVLGLGESAYRPSNRSPARPSRHREGFRPFRIGFVVLLGIAHAVILWTSNQNLGKPKPVGPSGLYVPKPQRLHHAVKTRAGCCRA